MDALALLLPRYETVHTRITSELVEALPDAQIRCIPVGGHNSIAWLIWHTTRVEDLVVNRFVAHTPQVFHDECWGERMRVSNASVGISMSASDVLMLSTRIDLDALAAYRSAVTTRTRSLMSRLRPPDLDEIVDAAYIDWSMRADDALGDGGGGPGEDWDSDTKGAYFSDKVLAHCWEHYGEARTIRALFALENSIKQFAQRGRTIDECAPVLFDTVLPK